MIVDINSNIKKPKSWSRPAIQITTSISPELWDLAKEESLSWKEALELGLMIQLADKNLVEYPECGLLSKMNNFKEMFETLKNERDTGKG